MLIWAGLQSQCSLIFGCTQLQDRSRGLASPLPAGTRPRTEGMTCRGCVHASESVGGRSRGLSQTMQKRHSPGCAPDAPGGQHGRGPSTGQRNLGLESRKRRVRPWRTPASDHEAVLLPVVGHQDDVAVGSPDEPGQSEGVVGAGGGRLHGGHLVGFDAAQLRGRVQHADAAQQGGVHLGTQGQESTGVIADSGPRDSRSRHSPLHQACSRSSGAQSEPLKGPSGYRKLL